MTTSELMIEFMTRDSGNTYAGGLTDGEIETIKTESAALRERVRARRDGTQAA